MAEHGDKVDPSTVEVIELAMGPLEDALKGEDAGKIKGAIQIKKIFTNAVLIFILPPSWEELRSRLERRGED